MTWSTRGLLGRPGVPCGAVYELLLTCSSIGVQSVSVTPTRAACHLTSTPEAISNKACSSGPLDSRQLTRTYLGKTKQREGHGYRKSGSDIWKIEAQQGLLWFPAFPGIWQIKRKETTGDPVRNGWFQVPGWERKNISLEHLGCSSSWQRSAQNLTGGPARHRGCCWPKRTPLEPSEE